MIWAALTIALGAFPAREKDDPNRARVTLRFEAETLEGILQGVRKITEIPIEVDDAARRKVDFENPAVFLNIKELPLAVALRILFETRGLKVKVSDRNKILITVPQDR